MLLYCIVYSHQVIIVAENLQMMCRWPPQVVSMGVIKDITFLSL